MPKFKPPEFYENEGFVNHFNGDIGTGGTTKSKFATKQQAQDYMQYCPYPLDFKIIYDEDHKAYRIKFRTGISRMVNQQKQSIKDKQTQLEILKATDFKEHQPILTKLINDLTQEVEQMKTELAYSEWQSTN